MTGGDRVANWKPGIGNYDDVLRADDYTALHMDAVKGYDGVFRTKSRFFEHYIHQQGEDWVDANPETNKLVKTIRRYESKGNTVKHIIICREGCCMTKKMAIRVQLMVTPEFSIREMWTIHAKFSRMPMPWAAETRQLQADTNGGSSSRFSRRS